MARNNSRIRRRVAEILFERGRMTRIEMAALLLAEGEFRSLPNDSSLTAMLSKNLQIKQDGFEMVDVGNGVKTKNVVYAINDEIIHDKEDLLYTRPYSTMTQKQKKLSQRCISCGQMRLIKDKWTECLVCQRRQPTDL